MKPQEAIDFLKQRFDRWKSEFNMNGWTTQIVVGESDEPTWYDAFPSSESTLIRLAPLDAVKTTPREMDMLVFRVCLNAVIEARDDYIRDGEWDKARPYEDVLAKIGDAAYWQMLGSDEPSREWETPAC